MTTASGDKQAKKKAGRKERRPRTPEQRRQRRKQTALAVLAGALYVVSFPGIDQWYLAFIAFVPLLVALNDPEITWKRALWLGLVGGFVSHLGGYY